MKTHDVGLLAAELMESLAEEYGDDAEVGVVAIVVEVDLADSTEINYRCSDNRRWVHHGLLQAAQRAVYTYKDAEDEEGDDE